jgi:hypothetical protein
MDMQFELLPTSVGCCSVLTRRQVLTVIIIDYKYSGPLGDNPPGSTLATVHAHHNP